MVVTEKDINKGIALGSTKWNEWRCVNFVIKFIKKKYIYKSKKRMRINKRKINKKIIFRIILLNASYEVFINYRTK